MTSSRCAAWVIAVAAIGCKGASKQEWIDRFEPKVVEAFCEPDQAFRVCFAVDQAGCTAEAKKTVEQCLDKVRDQLPDQFDEKSGEQWGGKIGECAGNAYEMDMRAQGKFKQEIAKCNDPKAWVK